MHCQIDNEHLTTAHISLVPPVDCLSTASRPAQVIQPQDTNVILRTSAREWIRREAGLYNKPYREIAYGIPEHLRETPGLLRSLLNGVA